MAECCRESPTEQLTASHSRREFARLGESDRANSLSVKSSLMQSLPVGLTHPCGNPKWASRMFSLVHPELLSLALGFILLMAGMLAAAPE
jgi:hypothetical protein